MQLTPHVPEVKNDIDGLVIRYDIKITVIDTILAFKKTETSLELVIKTFSKTKHPM